MHETTHMTFEVQWLCMPAIDAWKCMSSWHRCDFACIQLMHEATHVTLHCFDCVCTQLMHGTTHLIVHSSYYACTQQCLQICSWRQAHSCFLSNVSMQGARMEKEIGKKLMWGIICARKWLEHSIPSLYCVCFRSAFCICFPSPFWFCFRSPYRVSFQSLSDSEFAVNNRFKIWWLDSRRMLFSIITF